MSMTDFRDFECDRCGACCSLLVEPTYADGLREPKIVELLDKADDDWRAQWRVGDITPWMREDHTKRCVFCAAYPDGSTCCAIYATRPQQCVRVEAGDAKCQQAREVKGLPMLLDKHGQRPGWDLLLESCAEHDVDECPYIDEYEEGGG